MDANRVVPTTVVELVVDHRWVAGVAESFRRAE
jgi:hypothetical protein